MSEQAAHPIWSCDDDAIKREYQYVCDERDKYLSWHQHADSEAERLHFALEQLVKAADPYVTRAGPHEELFNGEDLRNYDALVRALGDALKALHPAPALPDTPEPVADQSAQCGTCGSSDWFFDQIDKDGTLVIHDARPPADRCPDSFHQSVPSQPLAEQPVSEEES